MESEFFNIVCDINGERLDAFLGKSLGEISRTRAKSIITDGIVTVSGKVRKPSYKLCVGDVIEGELPPLEEISAQPANIPLNIIYEDAHVIVVNKPKGLVVHPAPGHIDDTLVNGLLFHFGGNLSGIGGCLRPGIVHRIDKDTSGLIVVAKTDKAHLSLSEQLKNHSVERIYEAIVFGNIKDDEGTINTPIGRSDKNRQKMGINYKSGKNAVTHYKVMTRYGKYTHIEVRLETGRTHQIRVHMSSIGYPLLGDTVYSTRKQPIDADGQVLHAKVLGFVHPETTKFMLFQQPCPSYFQKLLVNLERSLI